MQTSIFQLEGRVDTISCMTIYTPQSWRLEVVVVRWRSPRGRGLAHYQLMLASPPPAPLCSLQTIHRFHKPSTGLFRDCTTSPIKRQQHYKCRQCQPQCRDIGSCVSSVCQPRPSDCQWSSDCSGAWVWEPGGQQLRHWHLYKANLLSLLSIYNCIRLFTVKQSSEWSNTSLFILPRLPGWWECLLEWLALILQF